MDERDAVAWLHRRAGFGLAPADLRAAVARGAEAELDRLLDPAGAGTPGADPWDDAQLPDEPRDADSRRYAIDTWIDALVTTPTPLVDRMAWLWHGHLVSALDKVKVAKLMVDQIRLFRTAGLGPLRDLLRATTIDPAMMVYLDLRTSTGDDPNENYARELLELFTLGVGNYAEADVRAGALALTGWRYAAGAVRFVPRRHDDTAQTYLGRAGVHDLDTVLDAIMATSRVGEHIAARVAHELLGTSDASVVAPLAEAFSAGGHDLRALVRETLSAGLRGASAPLVVPPLPWLVHCLRATGASMPARQRLGLLRVAGQLPMVPPNVAGWPSGAAWFGSATVVARANLAAAVAVGTPDDAEALQRATDGDVDGLAESLGLPSSGFGTATAGVLRRAPRPVERLALALAAPEMVVA